MPTLWTSWPPIIQSSLRLAAAVLAGVAAWNLSRHREDTAATVFGPLAAHMALLLLFALVTLEVRHAFHHPVPAGAPLIGELAERGTYAIAWLALGLTLGAIGIGFKRATLEMAGYLFVCIGLATALVLETLMAFKRAGASGVAGRRKSPCRHRSSAGWRSSVSSNMPSRWPSAGRAAS